jgi:hypothetical protein
MYDKTASDIRYSLLVKLDKSFADLRDALKEDVLELETLPKLFQNVQGNLNEIVQLNGIVSQPHRRTNMIRDEVFQLISEERDYQDSLRKAGRFEDERHPLTAEIVMMESYVRKVLDAYTDTKGTEAALHMIRKLAAICVRCLETEWALRR